MSTSPARIDFFLQDVLREGAVWAIHGAEGMPVIERDSGQSASPFWSSEAAAARFIEANDAYRHFDPIRITWNVFRTRWIPGLLADRLVIDVEPTPDGSLPCDIAPNALDQRMREASESWQPSALRAPMPDCRAA